MDQINWSLKCKDAVLKEDKNSQFTHYIFDLYVDNEIFLEDIKLRYSGTRKFYSTLKEKKFIQNFKFPSKSLFKFSVSVIETRKKELENFLNHIIKLPNILPLFLIFVINKKSTSLQNIWKIKDKNAYSKQIDKLLKLFQKNSIKKAYLLEIILYSLINKKDIENIDKLLNFNKSIDFIEEKSGNNSVLLSIILGSIDIFKKLISFNKSFEVKDNLGNSSIILATKHENYEIVRLLINSGAELDHKNFNNSSALTISAKSGNFKIFKELVENGASILSEDKLGYNSFLISCRGGHIEIVKYLLDKNVNINETNIETGQTGLMLSSWFGKYDVVKYLLSKGANSKLTDTISNCTAYDYSVLFKHKRIQKLFHKRTELPL